MGSQTDNSQIHNPRDHLQYCVLMVNYYPTSTASVPQLYPKFGLVDEKKYIKFLGKHSDSGECNFFLIS